MPGRAEARAYQLLFSEAALPEWLASSMVGGRIPTRPDGAVVFNGRPPQLRNPEQVMTFLHVDADVYGGLLFAGELIPRRSTDLGVDIDSVLHAQHFLSSELASVEQLSALVGFTVDHTDMRGSSFLVPWNRRDERDHRVRVADLEVIQLRLIELASAYPPEDSISVSKLAETAEMPARAVLRAVGRILDAQANNVSWKPPFRWSDLQLARDAAQAVIAS
jgi:hypothetical protein